MQLTELFSSDEKGYTGYTTATEGVTAASRAITGGYTGYTSYTENIVTEVNFTKKNINDEYPKAIICYTPNGKALSVMAESPEHETFLKEMNPL